MWARPQYGQFCNPILRITNSSNRYLAFQRLWRRRVCSKQDNSAASTFLPACEQYWTVPKPGLVVGWIHEQTRKFFSVIDPKVDTRTGLRVSIFYCEENIRRDLANYIRWMGTATVPRAQLNGNNASVRSALRRHGVMHGAHEAVHRLGQLSVDLVGDGHDIGQQQAEVQGFHIALQRSEKSHLQDSGLVYQH